MSGFISILGLLINATLIATPPLLLAALGSCFSERSGVVNIGIEGMMTIGAFTGTVVALYTGNGWLGFLCGGLAGAVFGLIHAVVCIQFQADQFAGVNRLSASHCKNHIRFQYSRFLCQTICSLKGALLSKPDKTGYYHIRTFQGAH